MVAESEVPFGTAEPVLFPGAPVVPKGTQRLDHPIFPALKRWAIFSEHKDAKFDPITPRVFKLRHASRRGITTRCGRTAAVPSDSSGQCERVCSPAFPPV